MDGSEKARLGRGNRIEIRSLRALALCGVLPEERERPQPLEIDLDLMVDLAPASASDDLVDTVDYGQVTERVAALAAKSSFQLLEALAGAVADEALATDDRIEAAAVTVRKLRPPIGRDVATVGVRVVRRRLER
jgi:dihydroneopterin aldolase